MPRWISLIVLAAALLASGCGQKGPLVLPEAAQRKPTASPGHDVPPAHERRQ
jgi:predicted small lipoprotein YifL